MNWKSVVAAVAFAVATIAATPADAQRRHHHRGYGPAIGLGVLGGVVAGAAIANAYGPRYAPQPGYLVYDGYNAGYPVNCPGGHWRRRPVAFDGYGNPVRWSRPRFVCP